MGLFKKKLRVMMGDGISTVLKEIDFTRSEDIGEIEEASGYSSKLDLYSLMAVAYSANL